MEKTFKPPKNFKQNYIEFGYKTVLNLAKLHNGILLVKYKSSFGPVNRLRSTPISSTLQQLIEEIVDTNELNHDTLKRLNQPDTKILELLLDVTKTKEHFNYKRRVKTIQDHIDRFNLLQASVEAGNLSSEIRTELVELLTLLSSPLVNRIDKNIADEMIDMFSN